MGFAYIVILCILSFFLSLRSIVYLQLNGYRLRLKDGVIRELALTTVLVLILDIVSLLSIFDRVSDVVVYSISILISTIYTAFFMKRAYKITINITGRLKRLVRLYLANIFLICTILLLINYYFRTNERMIMLYNCIFLISLVMMYLSNSIMKPYENHINKGYIEKAKSTLLQYPNTKVIGITGSYGKTSVKNILSTILSEKYKVKATPLNYNTPLGVSLAIGELDGDEDYFIVEMGARYVGDIAYLADMVHPVYGIITGVTMQHMETFKDIKVIEKTKYELYKSIPTHGLCIFNGNDNITYKMYNYSKGTNSILTHSNDIYADNISSNINGMSFNLHLFGLIAKCKTRLIGLHNIDNILLASTLAYKIGLSIEEIASGIEKIQPLKHRLELIHENGITIIDDSYNANICGVKSSIDTLTCFEGRKIVATQGVVEGGKYEENINTEIGRYMADKVDISILIGKHTKGIYKGLMDSGVNMQNVLIVKSLKDAENVFNSLLRRGDILLITNDLPDNY